MSDFYPFKDWLTAKPKDLITVGPVRTREQLVSDVRRVQAYLASHKNKRVLITAESVYNFLCLFIGTLLSGNRPILVPQKTIHLRGEQVADLSLTDQIFLQISSTKTDQNSPVCEPQLLFELFTSGSSGTPKKILKTVQQMDLEAGQTAALFTAALPKSVARTVDCEHQYGLTFSVWLPMSLGIPIHDKRISIPEQCSNLSLTPLLVSTPSFLNNLDKSLPAPNVAMVISAGSPLHSKAASLVWQWLNTDILEIYGSSEAGVIGFRKTERGKISSLWKLFSDLSVKEGFLFSTGRTTGCLEIDDILEFTDSNSFILKGRKDRICKIGEEKISLDHIEHVIKEVCSRQVKVLPIEKNGRMFLGAILLIPEQNRDSHLDGQTITALREQLRNKIPLLSLPRFWRSVPNWPRNNQGKIQISRLRELFDE